MIGFQKTIADYHRAWLCGYTTNIKISDQILTMKSIDFRKFGLGLGIILSILIYYYFRWRSLGNFVSAIDHCDLLFCDFSRVFYQMGGTIFSQQIPSRGFYYSPLAAILFSLWGFQPPSIALITWGMTQVITIVGLYVYWLPALQKNNFSFKFFYLFLLLTAFPLLHNFKWGQVSTMITLTVLLTMELYQTKKWIWAAFWLAFSVAFKFYPVIFLLYFVFKWDIKFLIAFAVFLFLLGIVIPVAFIGIDPTIGFYLSILKKGVGISVIGNGAINSLYFPSVILRLMGEGTGGVWLKCLQVIGIMILGINTLMVLLAAMSSLEHRLQWSFLLLFASIPFFVSTSWPHYFVYLPAFQASAFFIVEKNRFSTIKYILVFFSILLSSIIFFNFFDNWSAYAVPGFLFWSNLLLLLLAYVELIPRLRFSDALNVLRQMVSKVRATFEKG